MGMEATYRALSRDELDRLRADPDAADEFLWHADLWDDGEALLRKSQEEVTAGLRFELDKDWHALHFLLTGSAALDQPPGQLPLEKVVLGGADTDWDASYGRVRLLTSSEVAQVAAALRDVPLAELRRRFDPARFDELKIYPNPRPGGWTERQLESLWERYPALVRFFEAAAARGAVVLVYLE